MELMNALWRNRRLKSPRTVRIRFERVGQLEKDIADVLRILRGGATRCNSADERQTLSY
jgi:hypothetical protein